MSPRPIIQKESGLIPPQMATPNGSEPIKRYFAKSRSIILEGETAYRIGIPRAHGLIPPDRNSGARESIRDYSARHPGPADLALAVEVADSSLEEDRMQVDIYGRAGIPLYWIINLIDRQVEVIRTPPLPVTSRWKSSYRRMSCQ